MASSSLRALWIVLVPFLVAPWFPIRTAGAQTERYELGKRLRRFEMAWQKASPETRAAAVEPMNRAVQSFFRLQLRGAAAALDQAWYTVRKAGQADAPPDEIEKAIISQQLILTPLVCELPGKPIRVYWEPLYGDETSTDAKGKPAGGGLPADLRLVLELVDANGDPLATRELTAAEAEAGAEWNLSTVPVGDWRLKTQVRWAERTVELPDRLLSCVERFGERVKALEQFEEAAPDWLNATAGATLDQYLSTFNALLAGQPPEADLPVAQWLERAEAIRATKENPMAWVANAAREGDVWITLAKGRKKVPLRLRAPTNQEGPLGVLFLFHGAGGSENMFFETYGHGGAVRAGLDRSWLVVAPRQGLFGLPLDSEEIIAGLEEHFVIDREKIFAIGHSMGASQVMRQVAIRPRLFRAAVAVGGGGRPSEPEKLARIPWLIAAGAQDFGRSGAAALARGLKAADADVRYRELPDVEHMVIVQAALPLIFDFLDRQGAPPNAPSVR